VLRREPLRHNLGWMQRQVAAGVPRALIANQVLQAAGLRQLAGLECYEGLWGTGDRNADRAMALGLMQRVHVLARS
jgi:hypothetical protein